jgi:hypothetical protein
MHLYWLQNSPSKAICNAELPMREASVLGVPGIPFDSSLNRTALWHPAPNQSSAAPPSSQQLHSRLTEPRRRPLHQWRDQLALRSFQGRTGPGRWPNPALKFHASDSRHATHLRFTIPEGSQPLARGRGAERRTPREQAIQRKKAPRSGVPAADVPPSASRGGCDPCQGAGARGPGYRWCRRVAPQPPANGSVSLRDVYTLVDTCWQSAPTPIDRSLRTPSRQKGS